MARTVFFSTIHFILSTMTIISTCADNKFSKSFRQQQSKLDLFPLIFWVFHKKIERHTTWVENFLEKLWAQKEDKIWRWMSRGIRFFEEFLWKSFHFICFLSRQKDFLMLGKFFFLLCISENSWDMCGRNCDTRADEKVFFLFVCFVDFFICKVYFMRKKEVFFVGFIWGKIREDRDGGLNTNFKKKLLKWRNFEIFQNLFKKSNFSCVKIKINSINQFFFFWKNQKLKKKLYFLEKLKSYRN